MKRLIFGCALMICGVNAAIGWVIAACVIDKGASSIFSVLTFFHVTGYIPLILFIAVAVVGAVIAVYELKSDK